MVALSQLQTVPHTGLLSSITPAPMSPPHAPVTFQHLTEGVLLLSPCSRTKFPERWELPALLSLFTGALRRPEQLCKQRVLSNGPRAARDLSRAALPRTPAALSRLLELAGLSASAACPLPGLLLPPSPPGPGTSRTPDCPDRDPATIHDFSFTPHLCGPQTWGLEPWPRWRIQPNCPASRSPPQPDHPSFPARRQHSPHSLPVSRFPLQPFLFTGPRQLSSRNSVTPLPYLFMHSPPCTVFSNCAPRNPGVPQRYPA